MNYVMDGRVVEMPRKSNTKEMADRVRFQKEAYENANIKREAKKDA